MKFEASDQKIIDVIFSNYKFRIPRYQRPYAWGDDQISDFWNDLVESHEPYFLGSFILNYEPWENEKVIDIIDGQQRVLTITIFSAVLRDIATDYDDGVAGRIHRQDIMFEDRSGEQSPRVRPGDTTRDYFYQYIQNIDSNILESSPSTAEEKRIKKVYEFFYKKVSAEISKYDNNESKAKELQHLRDKVSNLIVIHVKIDNEEEAYEIFETTNARGIDLSVSDLLKNLIFKKIPAKDDRDLAKDIWQEITNNVESTNTELKRFLRYHWLSKYSFVTEKNLFREIKKKITNWQDLLDSLWTDSENWNKLLEGSVEDYTKYKDGHKIYDSIFAIKLMGVTQCHVFILSLLRNYKKIKTNPLKIIQLIEKFTFQYSAVSKKPGNVVENIYSRFAVKIDSAVKKHPENKISGEIQKIFSELEKELKQNLPSKELFMESFAHLSYKNSEKGRMLIKYILSNINYSIQTTKEHKINFYDVNIEHLLPQKPAKDWGLKREEIKSYVNLLGNLTLLSKQINSKVQNHTLEKKLPLLSESELSITKDLVAQIKQTDCSWSKETIVSRQTAFGDLAHDKIWNI